MKVTKKGRKLERITVGWINERHGKGKQKK
jgi:hypothetical protein